MFSHAPQAGRLAVAAALVAAMSACATPSASETEQSEESEPRELGLEIPTHLQLPSPNELRWHRHKPGASTRGTISNPTREPVTIESLQAPEAGGFMLNLWRDGQPVDPPVTLDPGARIDVTVLWIHKDPVHAGIEAVIHTDEFEGANYRIPFGTAADPGRESIEILPSRVVDFGKVPVGEARTVELTISGNAEVRRIARASVATSLLDGVFGLEGPPGLKGEGEEWIWLGVADPDDPRSTPRVLTRSVQISVFFIPTEEGIFETTHAIVAKPVGRRMWLPACNHQWGGWMSGCQFFDEPFDVSIELRGEGVAADDD